MHHVRVRLLDLVEQDNRIGSSPNGFGELPALFVTDISRRRTDEAGRGELLHVLRHVDLDERVGVSKHELRERARQKRLANAGWAQEDERANRTTGILEVGARTAQRLADGDHRFILTDHLAFEFTLHGQQLLGLLLLHPGERHARPLRNDMHDVVLGNEDLLFLLVDAPLGKNRVEPVLRLLLAVPAGRPLFRNPAP